MYLSDYVSRCERVKTSRLMEGLLKKLDDLAGIENEKPAVKWLERIAFVFLILMLVSAPHSIAATQTAWITGMFVWVVRLFFRPRLKLKFGALDFALWGFFAWSVVSSVASYEPATSIDKLRGTRAFPDLLLHHLQPAKSPCRLFCGVHTDIFMHGERAADAGTTINGPRCRDPRSPA